MRQYAAALDGVKAPTAIGSERTRPGSLDALVVSYYKLVFPRLKASTQAMRRNIIERIRMEHGKDPLVLLKREHIAAMLAARAATPEAANNLLKVLRSMLEHAVDIGMLADNPAARVKKFPTRGEGVHTWTEAEVAQFQTRHPIGSKAWPALALLLTAQRRSDVVRMGWQHIADNSIAVRQEKTDTVLMVPLDIDASLRQALERVPRTNMTFLTTEYGAPFSVAGFGQWFRQRCDEAGLPQCSAHGLRKLVATRLANAGCSEREIMAITGHKSVSEVSRYTKARDQRRLGQSAADKLKRATIVGTDGEQKLSPHGTGGDKMVGK